MYMYFYNVDYIPFFNVRLEKTLKKCLIDVLFRFSSRFFRVDSWSSLSVLKVFIGRCKKKTVLFRKCSKDEFTYVILCDYLYLNKLMRMTTFIWGLFNIMLFFPVWTVSLSLLNFPSLSSFWTPSFSFLISLSLSWTFSLSLSLSLALELSLPLSLLNFFSLLNFLSLSLKFSLLNSLSLSWTLLLSLYLSISLPIFWNWSRKSFLQDLWNSRPEHPLTPFPTLSLPPSNSHYQFTTIPTSWSTHFGRKKSRHGQRGNERADTDAYAAEEVEAHVGEEG
jgi:hypothetical protein